MEIVKKSEGFIDISLFKSRANPNESNPGPKFALVAGTYIFTSLPL
jgi:hypothetical protein